jgi:hypothetical protein
MGFKGQHAAASIRELTAFKASMLRDVANGLASNTQIQQRLGGLFVFFRALEPSGTATCGRSSRTSSLPRTSRLFPHVAQVVFGPSRHGNYPAEKCPKFAEHGFRAALDVGGPSKA